MSARFQQRRAFTLVELLLTVSIIGILATITIGTMSPRKQLNSSRDAKRQADVNAIMSAIDQYSIDKGVLPAGIVRGPAKEICTSWATSCNGGISLLMLSGTYIPTLPADPYAQPTETGSHYFISLSNTDLVTIFAPLAEGKHSISITR